MTDIHSLQQMVNLTAVALGVDDVQLVILGAPGLDLGTGRKITSSTEWVHRLGYLNCKEPEAGLEDGEVEGWVGSIAVAPLTAPSGEAGCLLAGHEKPDSFGDTTLEVLSRVVGLAETHLDRSVEQIRMDRLGEVLASNQDELREAKDRLLVSNEELEQFAYIAAHELVAPLRAVSLYAEVLEPLVTAEEIDHDQLHRCVRAIQTGVADMDQQVKQLLELSNVQGDLSEISSIDLTTIVDHALVTLAVPLDEAGAIVEVERLPVVRGRSVPLQSVFANLVSNALRYRHPGRSLRIRISAEQRQDQAIVHIADNGVGVNPEDRDRIFQMFERGSTATAGSGIGLALSRRIVEAVGGHLALASSSDQGAEFTISLRLANVL